MPQEKQEIYNNIRMMRVLKNISQEFMADEMGVSQSSYGKLERGATKVTREKMNKIAKIFKCDVFEIVNFSREAQISGPSLANIGNAIAGAGAQIARQALLTPPTHAEAAALKQTIETLKEIIALQKKTIALLESQNNG